MPVPTMAECVQMATAVVNRAWRHQVTHIVDIALKEPHVSRPAGIVIYPPTHTVYMAAATELQHELTKRSPQAWHMELALAGEDAGKATWTRAEDGR